MTNELKKLCKKLIFVLEGGYFKIPMCRSVEAVIRTILNEKLPY